MSYLLAIPEDKFSHDMAQLIQAMSGSDVPLYLVFVDENNIG